MGRLKEIILENVVGSLVPTDNKNCQIAVSTLVLNYSVASTTFGFDADLRKRCTTLASLLISRLTELAATYRTLIALGTLLEASSANVTEARAMDMKDSVKSIMMKAEQGQKIQTVAKLILNRL